MSNESWKSRIFGRSSILAGISHTIIKLASIVGICKQSDDMINEVLFYGPKDGEKKQMGLNNLFCIFYVIAHASRSVDICTPTLDSETLSKCLINVRTREKNYAQVRIIVHNTDTLRNLHSFISCGILVKIIWPKIKLEHEFIIIDANCADAVAILGSLDYEVDQVNHNRDNTLISSEVTLIKTMKREFDRIWDTETCLQVDENSSENATEKIEESIHTPTEA